MHLRVEWRQAEESEYRPLLLKVWSMGREQDGHLGAWQFRG